jgi:hypothetical protein
VLDEPAACATTKQAASTSTQRGSTGDREAVSAMSSRDQSLSLFVVRRTFTRVRRDHDPDEVDRHLGLVSKIIADARAEAERELATAGRAGEQLLAAARAEAAEAAQSLRAHAEDELRAYVERRRREADRIVQAARRERDSPS